MHTQEKIYHGAGIDPRPEIEKAQDYTSLEVASVAPVKWEEKPPSEWRHPPTRDQDGSGTCVAQTDAKLLGIDNENEEGEFIVFSATPIYQARKNRGTPGMYGKDALSIASTIGTTTEEKIQSQRLSEAQVEAQRQMDEEDKKIAERYKAGGYVGLIPFNIDAIADIIQNKKKGVMLFIFAEWDEWTDVPQILHKDLNLGTASIRHSITGVDVTLWKGEKSIVIDDSWGKFYGFDGQRVLTESWLKERCYFAGYLLDLSNKRNDTLPVPPKPKFKFTKPLVFNMWNDKEVRMLQNMLKFEELFPQNIESTGNYLQITARKVREWQMKHGILDFANEKDMRRVRFGPKSIALANKLYQ